MFDAEEMGILNALEKGELVQSVDAEEEITLVRQEAKEWKRENKI